MGLDCGLYLQAFGSNVGVIPVRRERQTSNAQRSVDEYWTTAGQLKTAAVKQQTAPQPDLLMSSTFYHDHPSVTETSWRCRMRAATRA